MASQRIALNPGGSATLWADFCTPPAYSGPGLVLCLDTRADDARVQHVLEFFAQEGYVVIAPRPAQGALLHTQDVEACVQALATIDQCKGQVGALSYGDGIDAALQCAAQGQLACLACYAPSGALLSAAYLARMPHPLPLLLHLPQTTDATATDGLVIEPQTLADAVLCAPKCQVYLYSDGGAEGRLPDERDAQPSAGIAHSRTLALLHDVIGPRYDLSALWDEHRNCEFVTRDAEATMRTMVAQPYVNHVPTRTGGFGATELHRFYSQHFIPNNPLDMRSIPVSRTVGADRVVNETILCFTHDREIEWMLPGIAPTGKYVEVALIGIITFRGGHLAHEHIYWDQASVLVQIGLLDPTGLPVSGAKAAQKVLDPSLPANEMMPSWPASAPN